MRIFRFDSDTGREIEQSGSEDAVFNAILRTNTALQIRAITPEPGGLVGHHEAAVVIEADGIDPAEFMVEVIE